jgi:polyhydroxybutyrate depolymerase
MERFSGLSDLADRRGFLVAYPDGSGRLGTFLTWNSGWCCGYARDKEIDDVGFLDRLLDTLIASGRVDPDRIYLTGMSNGAMMAYRYAAVHPERLAALGAVAGTADFEPLTPVGALPVVHLHGTKDDNVPLEGGKGSHTLGTERDHRPVQQTLDAWIRADGAGSPRSVTLPVKIQDGTSVTRTAWSSGGDSQAVVLYRVEGGGHAWPGRKKAEFLLGRATANLDADSALWDFFARHVRKGR